MGCVRDVLGHAPRPTIASIGISNQRETVVAWDADTSEPLHNAIVWQCRRTAERCAQLNADERVARAIRSTTGLPVDPYFSATKFEWLLQNVPAVEQAAIRGTLRLGTIDSWLIWKLSAGSAHATDYTNAARTMLFDIDRLCWSDDLVSLFGLPPSALPRVSGSMETLAVSAGGSRILSGIPIAGVAGDQQSALFGQGCFAPGTAKNTYGTGAFVLMNAGERRPKGNPHLITTLGCGTSGRPVYVLEGAIFAAGAVIQWLRDALNLLDSADVSQQMAEQVDDNGGVYFVPALAGLGAPYWDSGARGMITGITRGTKKQHVVRAALESVCFRTRDVIDAMVEVAGFPLTELRIDGGASANDFVCQFQADLLNASVVRPRDIETTVRGAAYLAGLGVGFWHDVSELEGTVAIERVFAPSMPQDQRERLYSEWTRAVRRALCA